MNSYGWALFILLVMACMAYFGSQAGYTVNGEPGPPGHVLEYLSAFMLFRVDGMPWFLPAVFGFLPFVAGWIVYRQIRGQS